MAGRKLNNVDGQKPNLIPLDLGVVPVDAVAKHGIQLEEGTVRFTIAAQKHAKTRHPDEFERCSPFFEAIVRAPTYVGQGPTYKDSFELVYEANVDELIILMALTIEKKVNDAYIVKSVYPINSATLERRLRKGFLTRV